MYLFFFYQPIYSCRHTILLISKSDVIECLVDRAMIVSSEKSLPQQESGHIKDIMVQNGYSETFVKKTIDKKMKRGS